MPWKTKLSAEMVLDWETGHFSFRVNMPMVCVLSRIIIYDTKSGYLICNAPLLELDVKEDIK